MLRDLVFQLSIHAAVSARLFCADFGDYLTCPVTATSVMRSIIWCKTILIPPPGSRKKPSIHILMAEPKSKKNRTPRNPWTFYSSRILAAPPKSSSLRLNASATSAHRIRKVASATRVPASTFEFSHRPRKVAIATRVRASTFKFSHRPSLKFNQGQPVSLVLRESTRNWVNTQPIKAVESHLLGQKTRRRTCGHTGLLLNSFIARSAVTTSNSSDDFRLENPLPIITHTQTRSTSQLP